MNSKKKRVVIKSAESSDQEAEVKREKEHPPRELQPTRTKRSRKDSDHDRSGNLNDTPNDEEKGAQGPDESELNRKKLKRVMTERENRKKRLQEEEDEEEEISNEIERRGIKRSKTEGHKNMRDIEDNMIDLGKEMKNAVADKLAKGIKGFVERIGNQEEESEEDEEARGSKKQGDNKKIRNIIDDEVENTKKNRGILKGKKKVTRLDELTREEKAELLAQFNVMQESRPWICLLHIIFKLIVMFLYMFMGLIVTSTLTNFLTCFLCIIFDFWITKNISGRLLVGMRWWSELETDEDGNPKMTFESFDVDMNFHTFDVNIFWWGMFMSAVFWSFMFVGKLLSFNFLWGMLTFIGMVLSTSNLLAYYQCYRYHRNKMAHYTNKLSGGNGVSDKLLAALF